MVPTRFFVRHELILARLRGNLPYMSFIKQALATLLMVSAAGCPVACSNNPAPKSADLTIDEAGQVYIPVKKAVDCGKVPQLDAPAPHLRATLCKSGWICYKPPAWSMLVTYVYELEEFAAKCRK